MWLAARAVVAAAMLAVAPPTLAVAPLTLAVVPLALAVVPLAILAILVCHCLLRCTTTTTHHATTATIAAIAPAPANANANATTTITSIAVVATIPTDTSPPVLTYIHSHVCSGHQHRHNRLPLLRAAKVVDLTTPRSTPTEEHGRELLNTLAVGQARKLHPLDTPVAASSHAVAAAATAAFG